MKIMMRVLAAVVLMAAFFFAGVRFCVLTQHIEVVGHNAEDYICTVEIFGAKDFAFAEWNPSTLAAREPVKLVDARMCCKKEAYKNV